MDFLLKDIAQEFVFLVNHDDFLEGRRLFDSGRKVRNNLALFERLCVIK